MSPAALAPPLSKEIRALLPVWAACVAAVVIAAVSRDNELLHMLAIGAYVVGPLAIGAHSIGQEYTHRTLPTLLAQPAARRRTYMLKFAVSATMLLTLAAFAWLVVVQDASVPASWRHVNVQILPVLGGLFVAPWLTMVCRSSLGGIIVATNVAWFSLFIPMAVVAWSRGIGAEAAEALTIGPWSGAMMAFCGLAGVLGLRRFMDLEAIEGGSRSFLLPRWLTHAEGARAHQPLRALAIKELHLQHLTLAVAGLFVFLSVGLSVLQRMTPSWSDFPIGAVMLLYCMSLAFLIGSMASAEERQHGTIEWQLLQPAPAWQQWTVKAGVSFALAVLLGVALPLLLTQLAPHQAVRFRASGDLTVFVVLLTACSLYVSSLSGSGVRAMVLSLPVGLGVALSVQMLRTILVWMAVTFAGLTAGEFAPFSSPRSAFLLEWLGRALTLVLVPLLLRFAFVNHTSIDRPVGRVLRQVGSIAAAVAIGMGLASLLLASIQPRG